MPMVTTLEAVLSVFFSSTPHHPSLSTTTHKPFLFLNHHHPSQSSSFSPITITKTKTTFTTTTTSNIPCFELFSALQGEVSVETETEGTTQEPNTIKRKLFVFNLPWSLSVADITNLFSVCGTVKDVEIIKQKDGKSRGFAFVTMSLGEEAQAVVDKFDSHEVSGRIIRVEFARRFKRPPPPPPPSVLPPKETRHKLYVSNLAWKARSSHLKALFSEKSNPVSARVVFDGERSAGYGFVSFATREEAEAAISAFDGKELLGRPICLKFSERKVDESNSEKQEEQPKDQPSSS